MRMSQQLVNEARDLDARLRNKVLVLTNDKKYALLYKVLIVKAKARSRFIRRDVQLDNQFFAVFDNQFTATY